MAVKIPPWNPIGGALELIGIGRAETPIGPDERATVTGSMYTRFIDDLHADGYELVPQSDIHKEAAYASLSAGHADGESAESSPVDYLRLLSTDIGVINASTKVPAPGTRLLKDDLSKADREKFETILLHNTHADATVSVHLLVGCYRDRAALEQNSQLRVMTADDRETTMTSQRSVLSDNKVRSPAHFVLIVGNVEPVKPELFDPELVKLLQPYLKPALAETIGDRP